MAYGFSKTITIDYTKCGSVDSTNFAVLFYGTYAGSGLEPDLRTVANGGSVTDADGDDIIFCASNDPLDLLDFERVSYTASTGKVVFWIRFPTLSASVDTVIYMFYGNASVTTYQGNTNGTWNSSYRFMIHGSNVLTDSTSNARDFSCASPGYTTGKFGTCIVTAATTASAPIRSDSGLPSGAGDRTIKMWIAWPSNAYTASAWGYGSFGGQDQRMIEDFATPLLKYIKSGDDITYSFTPTLNQFYHVILTFSSSGTVAKIYINGSNVATATKSGWSTTLGGTIYIGDSPFGAMPIKMQDFAIRNVVETPSEILAGYNNQNDPPTFYSFGATPGGAFFRSESNLSGIGGAGKFAQVTS